MEIDREYISSLLDIDYCILWAECSCRPKFVCGSPDPHCDIGKWEPLGSNVA